MRYARCNAENLHVAIYVCSDLGCDMKSFYQHLLFIGLLLKGTFAGAKVVSTVSYILFRYFLWTTNSKAIDVLFLP